ncbi:MAG: methylglyoxal synthase [Cyclobacteriaceae bacterium]|nr:methylglyoxal synthase [Cyclobacteriaceae bacterium]
MKSKMPVPRRIALVAHDHRKGDMIDWVKNHMKKLTRHTLYATGTTGKLLEEDLHVKIIRLKSGPLGGDQQLGALITEQEIDMMIFFWDPLEPQPHDPDVKALLRLAVVWNIPCASNQSTADFLISSPLFEGEYNRWVPDYSAYMNRSVDH